MNESCFSFKSEQYMNYIQNSEVACQSCAADSDCNFQHIFLRAVRCRKLTNIVYSVFFSSFTLKCIFFVWIIVFFTFVIISMIFYFIVIISLQAMLCCFLYYVMLYFFNFQASFVKLYNHYTCFEKLQFVKKW